MFDLNIINATLKIMFSSSFSHSTVPLSFKQFMLHGLSNSQD